MYFFTNKKTGVQMINADAILGALLYKIIHPFKLLKKNSYADSSSLSLSSLSSLSDGTTAVSLSASSSSFLFGLTKKI